MADPFVSQLASLCLKNPTRSKWVIVPTHALGHTIGDRLVLEGTNWANLRFKTPFDLALEIAAPFLVEHGLNPVSDDLGVPLVMRLLAELPEDVPSYFRHLALQPPMAAALWRTISELRMAELSGDALTEEAFENQAKRAELQALLTSYERYLTENGLADGPVVFTEALRHLDYCPISPGDVRIELPEVAWSPLVRRFLEALPGEVSAPAVLDKPGLSIPRRLSHSPSTQGDTSGAADDMPTTDTASLRFLMSPEDAPTLKRDGSLSMFHAGGREAEVEEVFRRIAATGLPLDAFEIACASTDSPLLIWQKAQRYGWPLTISGGVPVVVTRPGRALLGLLDWVETGFPSSGLRRLLQSGDVRLEFEDGPSSAQADRLLARAGATWGRSTYRDTLMALARSDRERAADPDSDPEDSERWLKRATQVERLRDWLDGLLRRIPHRSSDSGPTELGDLIAVARWFVATHGNVTSEIDSSAVRVITVELDQLGLLGDVRRPLRDSVKLVRSILDGPTVGSDRARPGHVHVTGLTRAGWAGRPQAFVVGLEEGRVFPTHVEDPVLLDDERRKIDPRLVTSADRASEGVHAVVSRLAAIGMTSPTASVTLSYSCRDLRQYRTTFPSWVLLQVRRLGVTDNVTFEELFRDLGEPKSIVPSEPAQALSDAGWWLSSLTTLGTAGTPSVLESYPCLKQGQLAESYRQSASFTAFDGFVPAAGPVLDPRETGRAMSATRLENLARCPYRHFLQYGLGLVAPEEAEQDHDVWLDPLTRGSELHDLYAAMMRKVRDETRRIDSDGDRTWLHARAEKRLEALRTEIPPPSVGVFERERKAFLFDLDLFLDLERASKGRTPVAFEVGFGLPVETTDDGESVEPLAREEPLEISLADVNFRLRGRIDRIDQVGDHEFEVVDYKTGGYFRNDFGGVFRGGRLLQHALYGLAATDLLRRTDSAARVTAGAYYFPGARGGGEWESKPTPTTAKTAEVLVNLFDTVRDGAFVHSQEAGDCRFCDFQAACGASSFEQAAGKIGNRKNKSLKAYRQLQTHE